MYQVAINKNVYEGANVYAKLHNTTIAETIEKAVLSFLQSKQSKQNFTETTEYKQALAYVKTLKAKGGRPVPEDENGLDALVDKKYML